MNSLNSSKQCLLIPDESTLPRLVAAHLDLPISQRLLNQNFKLSIIKRCWDDQLRLKHDDFASDIDLLMACVILQKQIKHIGGKKENTVGCSNREDTEAFNRGELAPQQLINTLPTASRLEMHSSSSAANIEEIYIETSEIMSCDDIDNIDSALKEISEIIKRNSASMHNPCVIRLTKEEDRKMKTLFVLLVLVSSTLAYIEESALAALQTVDHWNIFRIIISDNTEECFYLPVKLNDTIHVIYQVLKGGNSVMRAIITDPLNTIIYSQPNHQFGWYNQDYVVIPGVYRMCFKNEEYFAAKTLYLAVLAVHQDFISEASVDVADEKKANATSFLDEFSTSVMSSLNNISGRLYRLSAYQTVARVQHLHDMYAVEANASYVQYWAIWQIITMIVCSATQVYSIRRLFK
ncbi:unnamed protein product [Rotaria socialis]|uniref:GOLD domain-containing protein n=2 Tax=Rotaria socialis TaxID=392032 RepID=A0A821FCP8_9BILA|nr:unnamed protein product [Rotaria socialis]